ncbi:Lipopolysaccharide-responsive and beige-like anchor protein, partial [Ophiophagus hannah]
MASEERQSSSSPSTGDDKGGGGGGGSTGQGKDGSSAEKHSLNPGIPIRGIRMKFAVLTGLVEVGEVSNRDIVETVFNLLVGGHFDLEMNFIIQEGEGITCMLDLLDKCDVTCQAEIWSMFTAILKKSIRNLQICTEVGLIEHVLQRIDRADNMIADLLVDMLGVLASYSVTVRELKLYFSKLQGDRGKWAIALPPIANFRTSKGLGYSAHFVGGCLVVTSIKSKGKGFQHCVKFDFKPQKWYMVTIVHIYNRWKNSELRCYVNGELASYGEITWFVNASDTFDKCFLGSSETADANRVFCGQMTAVYLFSEALNAAQIFAIYQLGLGYKGTFKFKGESDLFLADHHKQLLYDGKLSNAIAFTYNPRATDAQLCLESSPKDNPSIFVHSPHALMLQDVKAVITHSIQGAMHSIGGVQVSILLAFIMELLKNSVAMQEQMLSCKGFLVIGYSLEKSSKAHINRTVLDLCLAFAKYLSNLHNGAPLLKQLCDHILLNPVIWIYTPAKVQLMLYTYLSTEFIGIANIYNAIRRVGTVLLAMHTLKYYYWVVNPQDRSGITPKGLDGPRPNQKEILSLRACLLMFIKQLVTKDYGVKEDELQGILNYLLTIHEDENLKDVLQLLVALMSEHPSSMIPAFDQRNGLRRKAEIMIGHGLFSLLTERLTLQTNLISMTTYNVLFEILIEQICTQVMHKQHPDPDSTVKIQNPQVLKVIAVLLRNSPPCSETMEVHRVFLSDMIKLFNSSRENRRSLLQCSVWQEWMLSLCYFNPQSSDEQKITEMVYAIFRILLYHAIKYEWGGWRVWVDTLAITHSKVTFEIYKQNLSRMFREYEEKGDECCSAGPSSIIRTVSGISKDPEVTEKLHLLEKKEADTSTVDIDNRSMNNSVMKDESRLPDFEEHSNLETNKEKNKTENIQKTLDLNKAPSLDLSLQAQVTKQSSEHTAEIIGINHEEKETSTTDSQSPLENVETLESPEMLENVTPEVYVEEDEEFVDLKEETNLALTSEQCVPKPIEEHDLCDSQVTSVGQQCTASSKEPVSIEVVPEIVEGSVETEQQDCLPETSGPEINRAQSTSDTENNIDDKNTNQPQTKTVVDSTQPQTSEAIIASDKKIARLDVSSIASDTERLELKPHANPEVNQPPRAISETSRQYDSSDQNVATPADGQRKDSRTTMFRIPEFRWSQMHQRLLTDLLFSIETDVQMWRSSHSTKTVMDFVNSSDNVIFVHNTIHLVSQVMDNMIMACGGILPLLSAATSATHELESIEPTQGLSVEASIAFLQRLISLVDVLIFASSLGFTEIESEKNMSSGGILRQCLRLVDIVTGGISPIRDIDRLLQDMDINRLRAVVFRDIEDSKQAQFLALAVVYFISVLMVSKYRDILEPQDERRQFQPSQSPKLVKEEQSETITTLSQEPAEQSESVTSPQRRDSRIQEEAHSGSGDNSEMVTEPERQSISTGPDAISEILCTLSSEVNKSQENKNEVHNEVDGKTASSVQTAKNVNVKDILRSLVSAPADGATVDPTVLPPVFLGVLGDGAAAVQPIQFQSFDRSVVVAPKKSASSSAATINVPTNAVSVVSSLDSSQAPDVTGSSPSNGSSDSRLPSVPTLSSVPEDSASNMSISERLEHALEKAAPLLREIFVDFAPFLSRTLLGSHGQELLIEGLVCMKSSSSVVELVMLLCSQEWQNSIQKNAGLAFIELVNEGRLLSQTMKDHLVRVANEAEFILSRQRAEDIHRHAEFESLCAQYSAEKREDEKMCDHLIRAAKYRDHVTATQLIQKIINILMDKHGAWGNSPPSRPREFWRLDYWEDDLRRRRRFVRNPLGSTHPEATLKAAIDHAPDEDVLVKGKQSIKNQALGNQNSESEVLLEVDDDNLSSMEEKELENLTGPISLCTPAQLVAPCVVVKGTLSITSSEVYFEVDEEEPIFKKMNSKVRRDH